MTAQFASIPLDRVKVPIFYPLLKFVTKLYILRRIKYSNEALSYLNIQAISVTLFEIILGVIMSNLICISNMGLDKIDRNLNTTSIDVSDDNLVDTLRDTIDKKKRTETIQFQFPDSSQSEWTIAEAERLLDHPWLSS